MESFCPKMLRGPGPFLEFQRYSFAFVMLALNFTVVCMTVEFVTTTVFRYQDPSTTASLRRMINTEFRNFVISLLSWWCGWIIAMLYEDQEYAELYEKYRGYKFGLWRLVVVHCGVLAGMALYLTVPLGPLGLSLMLKEVEPAATDIVESGGWTDTYRTPLNIIMYMATFAVLLTYFFFAVMAKKAEAEYIQNALEARDQSDEKIRLYGAGTKGGIGVSFRDTTLAEVRVEDVRV